MRFVALSLASGVRREMFQGREHLVVPVVALVEGVLNSELVLADEFAKSIHGWNGRPVVYRHPYRRGVPISANATPEVADAHQIGHLFNARMEGSKFVAEMWIDLERAKALGEEVMERVIAMERGDPVEVSTGYFAELEPVNGEYNGKPYSGIQRNILPDHLAVLAKDEIGACSWEDGCGAPRVAHRKTGKPSEGGELVKHSKVRAVLESAMRALGFTPNQELSHDDIRDALHRALIEQAPDGTYIFIRDVFDDRVIYEEGGETGPERLLERRYVIDENGNVTLGQDVVEVRIETRYVPVEPAEGETATEAPTTNTTTPAVNSTCACGSAKHTKGTEGDSVTKQQLIDALIANSATRWTEEDRALLEAMDEALLRKMLPAEPVPVANDRKPERPRKQTAEDVIANIADPELRAEFQRMLKARRDRREAMVQALVSNSRCRFTAERLRAMSDEDLEALYESLMPEDYSARPWPRANSAEDDDSIPAPPLVVLARAESKEVQ